MTNFNFYKSNAYLELMDELEENKNDVETCIDIIADIETAKKNFNSSLPWWYKARWSAIYTTDPEVYKEACNIYNKEITTCNHIK